MHANIQGQFKNLYLIEKYGYFYITPQYCITMQGLAAAKSTKPEAALLILQNHRKNTEKLLKKLK